MATRRWLRWGIVGLATMLVAAVASTYVAAIRPARRFLAEARRLGVHGADAIAVTVEVERDLGAPRPPGVTLYTAAGAPRDVVALPGRTVTATGGGAVVADARGTRLVTTLDGLADVDLRAAAPFAGGVVVGGADGRLTVLGAERLKVLRLGTAPTGPVQELLAADGLLLVAWLGGGAAALDPDGLRAVALDAAPGGGRRGELRAVAALAAGRGRYALGTAAGAVYLETGQGLRPACAAVPGGRITALAFAGETLLVGTPLGLFQSDGRGACAPLAANLFVTALAVDGPLVYAATFDDGVHVFDRAGGGARAVGHLLPGVRVERLRRLGGAHAGTLVAVGPGGVHALGAAAARPLPWPRATTATGRLAGPHVTALLRGPGGRLYVGTFEHGITVLGPDGAPLAHLPRHGDAAARQINALAYLPESREVAVATVRGVVLLGEAGERRLTPREGLGGPEVAALGRGPDGALFVATNRGLTRFGPGGQAPGRTIGAFHGLGNNHTYAVAASGETLFVGTLGGLALVRDLKVSRTLAAGRGPLRHSWITALTPAAEAGAVWVGTYGGGVARVNEAGVVESVAPDEPGFHVNQGALARDPVSGAVVVGTLERGALVVDPRRRTVRPLPVPLPSSNVTAVLVERDALFLGTDRGLLQVTRAAAGLAAPCAASQPCPGSQP